MTIDAARGHIGHRVVRLKGTDQAEEGVISFTGGRSAFVRYDGEEASTATDPADLTLLAG